MPRSAAILPAAGLPVGGPTVHSVAQACGDSPVFDTLVFDTLVDAHVDQTAVGEPTVNPAAHVPRARVRGPGVEPFDPEAIDADEKAPDGEQTLGTAMLAFPLALPIDLHPPAEPPVAQDGISQTRADVGSAVGIDTPRAPAAPPALVAQAIVPEDVSDDPVDTIADRHVERASANGPRTSVDVAGLTPEPADTGLVDAHVDQAAAGEPTVDTAAHVPGARVRGPEAEAFEPEAIDADVPIELHLPAKPPVSPDGVSQSGADVRSAVVIDTPRARAPLALVADAVDPELVAEASVPEDVSDDPADTVADQHVERASASGARTTVDAGGPTLEPADIVQSLWADASGFHSIHPIQARVQPRTAPIVAQRPATMRQFPSREGLVSEPPREKGTAATPLREMVSGDQVVARMLRLALARPASPDEPLTRPAQTERAAEKPSPEAQAKDGATAYDGRPTRLWAVPQANPADDWPVRTASAHLAAAVAYDIPRLPERGGSFDSEAKQNDRRANSTSAPAAVRAVQIEQMISSHHAPFVGVRTEDHVRALFGSIANDAGNARLIAQAIRLQSQNGVGTAVVNLDPDYLGSVTIALRVEGGAVTATVHAENAQVRSWLEANEPMLRLGLAGQGLALDRLLVSEQRQTDWSGTRDGRRRDPEQEQREPPRKPFTLDARRTFDVVV